MEKIPPGEVDLLCATAFGVERVLPVWYAAVSHWDERRSGCEPTVAALAPTDGSPDFWLRGAARAVSLRPSDGCCRGARVPGPRLAQGGVGVCRTPTDGRCPRRAPATTRAPSWLSLDRTQSKPSAPDRRGTDIHLPSETPGATLASGQRVHGNESAGTPSTTEAERTEPTRS